jgi:nicotinamidase-related amidase
MDRLVVIDLQEGFRAPSTANVIPQAHELMRGFGANTTLCQFYSEAGDKFDKLMNWRLFENPKLQAFMHEMQLPKQYDLLRHKTHDLTDKLLAEPYGKNVERWFLAGIYTEIAIMMTSSGMFDRDIPCYVITDAIGTPRPEYQEWALKIMGRLLPKKYLITTDEALAMIASEK